MRAKIDISENETKNEKFLRIATPRVQNIISKIEVLSNCASSNYEYTEEQVEAMFGAIMTSLTECKKSFQSKKRLKKRNSSFDLKLC